MSQSEQVDEILKGLNPAQKSAVTSPADVLQILAPPGSGKTKTLTSRVAYLLVHEKYEPWNVIVATFTVKAAREMKERISRMIGEDLKSKLILGTFHGNCYRYLSRYGHLIGLKKGFTVADSSESLEIIKRFCEKEGKQMVPDPYTVRTRISRAKARYESPAEFEKKAQEKQAAKNKTMSQYGGYSRKKPVEDLEVAQIYQKYEDALEEKNMLDFDDLLLRCIELLEKHPRCVSNVEAVLIDEFQDTNVAQLKLLRLFAQAQNRITTVGDPDQSIYSFRCAEIKNITSMAEAYPEMQVINLEENYRSSGSILQAALGVIEQDPARSKRPLLPTHCVGTSPVCFKHRTKDTEAKWIVSEINRAKAQSNSLLGWDDFAILIRSAFLSRSIESALASSGIPYRMVGGFRFYDRYEIKTLLSYLQAIADPDNDVALLQIINVPKRSIGDKAQEALRTQARAWDMSVWGLLQEIASGKKMDKKIGKTPAMASIGALVELILVCIEDLEAMGPDQHLGKCVEMVIDNLDFMAHLEEYDKDEDKFEVRKANVEEFIGHAKKFSSGDAEELDGSLPIIEGLEQEETTENFLRAFLSNVALTSEPKTAEENETSKGRVTISTIHGAKGLEWPVVFVPAVYEGSIPHSRADDHDEERRLLYVAITRAKALLYLSYPTEDDRPYAYNSTLEVSPFLPEQLTKSLFSKKVPTLGREDINTIARILGRSCASPKSTESSKKPKAASKTSSSSAGDDDFEDVLPATAFGNGFTSASSHLKELNERSANEIASKKRKSDPQEKRGRPAKKATTTTTTKSQEQDSSTRAGGGGGTRSKKVKSKATNGSILQHFTRTPSPSKQQPPPVTVIDPMDDKPDSEIVPTSSQQGSALPPFVPAIDPALAAHSLNRPPQLLTRPICTVDADAQPRKEYHFLSSSPPVEMGVEDKGVAAAAAVDGVQVQEKESSGGSGVGRPRRLGMGGGVGKRLAGGGRVPFKPPTRARGKES